jgi:multidrug efflux pump subunit AcrB
MESMKRGYLVALIGIFMILALLFRSYLQPLLIMTTIPLGIVGAIVGHYALNYPFSMMSMFGVIALTGVVVNDALVMIDRINERQRGGMPVLESVLDAGPSRFRAIMMTTLTTIAGLLPLLMERSFQAQFLIPMAISLSFGLALATFLTLFFVPALYLLLTDLRRVAYWLGSGAWPSRELVEPACRQGLQPQE